MSVQNIPQNLRYTKTHEWVQDLSGGRVRVGLTDHAQHELGDIVFVNLSEPGDVVQAGGRLADVESVKAVSDVYSPIGGTVAAINEALLDDPSGINADAYGAWLAELCDVPGDPGAGLMTAEEYAAFIKESDGGA